MNSLRLLDLPALHDSTLKSAERVRNEEHVCILHLAEMERRRGYLDFGHSSLFSYVVRELKFSEGAASARIAAARLHAELPEIENEIREGSLNLTNLSKVQNFIRAEEKRTGEKLDKFQKLELVQKVENKTTNETLQILADVLPEVPVVKERERVLPKGEISVTLVLDADTLKKIERLKELNSHKNDNPSWAEFFGDLIDQELKRKDPLQKPVKKMPQSFADDSVEKNSGKAIQSKRQPIKITIQRALHHRAQSQCEHVDAKTGKRCERRYHLQFDHIVPVSKGGTNAPGNLQLLCRAHNLRKSDKLGL